jgi:hypothetical protein
MFIINKDTLCVSKTKQQSQRLIGVDHANAGMSNARPADTNINRQNKK